MAILSINKTVSCNLRLLEDRRKVGMRIQVTKHMKDTDKDTQTKFKFSQITAYHSCKGSTMIWWTIPAKTETKLYGDNYNYETWSHQTILKCKQRKQLRPSTSIWWTKNFAITNTQMIKNKTKDYSKTHHTIITIINHTNRETSQKMTEPVDNPINVTQMTKASPIPWENSQR